MAICFFLALWSGCSNSVAPPSESPAINEFGREAVTQALYGAQTLRAVHDIAEVTESFDFTKMVLDTPWLSLELWSPDSPRRRIEEGLARARTSVPPHDLSRALSRALVRSAGETPKYDSLILADSLASPQEDSAFVVSLPAQFPGWDSAYDVVYGVWTDSVPQPDSVMRIRLKDTLSALVADTLSYYYDGGEPALGMRIQAHRSQADSSLAYLYRAKFGEFVKERIRVLADGDTSYVYHFERNNDSSYAWADLSSAALLQYQDSLFVDTHLRRARKLLRNIGDGEVRSYAFEFGQRPQTIRVQGIERRGAIGNSLPLSAFDFVQVITEGDDTLKSYTQRDSLANNNSSAYEIARCQDTVCTLSIEQRFADKRTTVFGAVGRSRLVYVLNRDAAWEQVQYRSLLRTDSLESGDYRYAQWRYIPESPVDFGGERFESGERRVILALRTSHPNTRERRWSCVDTGATSRYTFTWVGVARGDTVHCILDSNDSRANYAYYYRTEPRPDDEKLRQGRIDYTADSLFVYDTLGSERRRVVRAALSTTDSGDAGRLTVSGESAFAATLSGDSIVASCGEGEAGGCPLEEELVWRMEDGAYIAALAKHEGGYRFEKTGSGLLSGAFGIVSDGSNDAVLITDMQIDPLYNGAATVYGAFENVGDGDKVRTETLGGDNVQASANVSESLHIRLWGRSCFLDETCID